MIREFMIPILVCLLLLQGICLAQSQTKKDKDDEVTPREKRELQRISKLFVRRYQQTRDIKPLINEFFLKDFISYADQDRISSSPKLWPQLTKSEKIRDFVAYFNYLYVVEVAMFQKKPQSVDVQDEDMFAALFPERIAKKLKALSFGGFIPDRQKFVKSLSALEQAVVEARAYIKKRNYERSSEFKKNLSRLAKDEKLGFRIEAEVQSEGIGKKGSMELRVFPPGVKTYTVTTPLALVIGFVKVKGQYKILTIIVYDD